MRKPPMSLEEVKKQIIALKGQDVSMSVNRGRNKIVHYEGVLEDIYHSVFVVKSLNQEKEEKLSYSFTEVLCGDVKIAVKK